VNGSLTANYTVLAACQVPNFSGVQSNQAQKTWTDAGFAAVNITIQPSGNGQGNGNYRINTQSLSGGTLNPSGGCSGAEITVGP